MFKYFIYVARDGWLKLRVTRVVIWEYCAWLPSMKRCPGAITQVSSSLAAKFNAKMMAKHRQIVLQVNSRWVWLTPHHRRRAVTHQLTHLFFIFFPTTDGRTSIFNLHFQEEIIFGIILFQKGLENLEIIFGIILFEKKNLISLQPSLKRRDKDRWFGGWVETYLVIWCLGCQKSIGLGTRSLSVCRSSSASARLREANIKSSDGKFLQPNLTIVAVDAESDESAVKEDEKVCCIVCGTGFNEGDATRSATNFSAAFHVKRDGPFWFRVEHLVWAQVQLYPLPGTGCDSGVSETLPSLPWSLS